MFSTLPKMNLNFSFTFILSSADALNLDQSKNLLFGKELNSVLPELVHRNMYLPFRLFHLIITLGFQILIMRDMEKLTGATRMAIIYIGAGVCGNLGSCIFVPYQVEVIHCNFCQFFMPFILKFCI